MACRQTIRPGSAAKTGLRCLGEWPKSELLCTLESVGMQVTSTLLFKGNVERLEVKFAAGVRITDDWSETRDEQNFDFSQSLHRISSSHRESGRRNRHSRNEFSP